MSKAKPKRLRCYDDMNPCSQCIEEWGFLFSCLVDLTSYRGTMSLTDLWEKSKAELQAKNVQQIISFAGNGKLTDGSITSDEFRAFLKGISTDLIQKYPK